jgi:hypothetical protein
MSIGFGHQATLFRQPPPFYCRNYLLQKQKPDSIIDIAIADDLKMIDMYIIGAKWQVIQTLH